MVDIVVTDITSGTTDGTGVFDKLMTAVNAQIASQFELGRIPTSDYANVYLGSLQAVLQQSVQYVLQEKSIEAQISLQATQQDAVRAEIARQDAQSNKDLLLKQVQIDSEKQKVISMQVDDSVKQIQSNKDIDIKERQTVIAESQSSKDLLVKQKQIDNMDSELTVRNAQSSKDLLVKDAQIDSEKQKINSMILDDSVKSTQSAQDLLNKQAEKAKLDYEVNTLLVTQNNVELENANKIRSSRINEELVTTQDIAVKQAQKLQIDSETSKNSYEVSTLLPKQVDEIQSKIDATVADTIRQDMTASKQVEQLNSEISKINYDVTNTMPAQLAVIKLQDDELQARIIREDMLASKELELKDAQKAEITTTTSKIAYEVNTLQPKQATLMDKQINEVAADTIRKDLTASNQAALLDAQKVDVEASKNIEIIKSVLQHDSVYYSSNKSNSPLAVADSNTQHPIAVYANKSTLTSADKSTNVTYYDQETGLAYSWSGTDFNVIDQSLAAKIKGSVDILKTALV